VFNPGLVTAEQIEAGRVDVEGRCVLELGCGAGLPSLVAASLVERRPEMVVLTDYPDDDLMEELRVNIDRNKGELRRPVYARGYAWGEDAHELLSLLAPTQQGYDILILADLLHLTPPIHPLLNSLTSLLARTPTSRAYISVGAYTKQPVVEAFRQAAGDAGLAWEDWDMGGAWEGSNVQGVGEVEDKEGLIALKVTVRGWIVKWR